MRVVVAYNDDAHLKRHLSDVELLGETEVIDTAAEVAHLTGGTLLPVRDVRDALDTLRRQKPEVVFNLCEGAQGNPRWEMHFALALEMLGIPFTGCDPIATAICGDKVLAKQLLRVAGCPVPGDGKGPWIVKPSREDAGIGIEAASVCNTEEEVRRRVKHVETTYRQPALVEEFIDGRELNQALYFERSRTPVILPPGEIVFSDELAASERVVGMRAKWDSGSREDLGTVSRTPGVMNDTTRSDLATICTKAATVLSLGGYCRLDVRQRPSGELCIIDVNPNPDIGRESGFRKALAAAGIEFGDFLNELMISALSRRP